VWWGLRQMADGQTPSPYEIVIFGGPHADLPITPHADAIIGETVASIAAIDAATGYKRSSRDVYLQRLGARQLVVPEGRGAVRASVELFE
jgi:hypothetical protein